MNIEEKKAQLQKIADEFNQLIKSSDRESAMPYLYKFLANEEAFGQYINIVFLNNTPNLRFFDQTVLFVLATDPDVRQIMLGKIAKHLGVKREEPKKEDERNEGEVAKGFDELFKTLVTIDGERFDKDKILSYPDFQSFLMMAINRSTGRGKMFQSKRDLAEKVGVSPSYFSNMPSYKNGMPTDIMDTLSELLFNHPRVLLAIHLAFADKGKEEKR